MKPKILNSIQSKAALLVLFIFIGHCLKAQLAITPDGLMSADDPASNSITYKYPGVSKEKLLAAYVDYAETYSKKRGVSFFNQQQGLMLRFERVGRFGTTAVKTGSVSFSLLFVIQDESVTVMARDFRLYRIGLFKGEAKQYIYTKKGKLSRPGKVLKPMVEREINLHFNEMVDTVTSVVEITGEA